MRIEMLARDVQNYKTGTQSFRLQSGVVLVEATAEVTAI